MTITHSIKRNKNNVFNCVFHDLITFNYFNYSKHSHRSYTLKLVDKGYKIHQFYIALLTLLSPITSNKDKVIALLKMQLILIPTKTK